jgi:5-formyltetrahydrofolate cyclo-ligase
MGPQIQEAKRALRQKVRAELANMTDAERATASAQARALLAAQPRWQRARSVLFFAPLPEELDVWPLLVEALAAGKTVCLPRFAAEKNHYIACQVENPATDLKPGQFGIREPVEGCAPIPLKRLDLILVPGIAYDLHGRRLGRGKGFYDRLLAGVRGTTCGVAFDLQIVRELPVEPHDAHVDCILTPTRWLEL